MANKVIKYLNETYGKQSLVESLKAGGWKGLIDGNIAQELFIHGPGGKFKGKDQNGNKYYERMTEIFGRHRWVVYGDLRWPEGQDPNTIPPEWHGWINHITDISPADGPMATPFYAIQATPIKTGTPEAYNPKGAWKNPQKRNWTKVQTWQPPSAAGNIPV